MFLTCRERHTHIRVGLAYAQAGNLSQRLLFVRATAQPSNHLTDQALTKGEERACTPACTPNAKTGNGDFAAALAMIATLPLSNEEKAEAVRRLLATANRTGN
jgi:hypothetical protein